MKPPKPPTDAAPGKAGLHRRNRHRGRYDFPALAASSPELARFVGSNAWGDASIDFADPAAVKALNRALLKLHYGIAHWDIPTGYLCPPIPGRADYLHRVADLLAGDNRGLVPRGERVRVLDVGVGANCIYPLIGHREYGWSFVGADIDPHALTAARGIVERNPGLASAVLLRRQNAPAQVFSGVVAAGEIFDLTLCNPPFHASLAEAHAGTHRKWRNLGKEGQGRRPTAGAPSLNFGGQGAELHCPGGEAAFVRRMVAESAGLAKRCLWFTTLVSKAANLPGVLTALQRAGACATQTLEMAQGQKKSRIVAWTFLGDAERAQWATTRWAAAAATAADEPTLGQ
jgi:23S rRNA (adenine1618-N6)-methyltransferase